MNKKHLAVLLVGVLILVVVQVMLVIRGRLTTLQQETADARAEVERMDVAVQTERNLQVAMQSKAAAMLQFLASWEPELAAVGSSDAGEALFNTRVKESGIVGLSQRYEVIPNKGSTNIPRALRAAMTFEDDYQRVLDWLIKLESEVPASRLTRVRLSRGQSGNDLRMELTADLPLAAPASAATPAP